MLVVVLLCASLSTFEVVGRASSSAYAEEPQASSQAAASSDAADEESSSGSSQSSESQGADDQGDPEPSDESASSAASEPEQGSSSAEPSSSSSSPEASSSSSASEPSSSSSSAEPSKSSASSDTVDSSSSSSSSASSDETPVQKAKRLIAALPADPDDITESYRSAVEAATEAYNALTPNERAELDSTKVGQNDVAYGRWLESAQWAIEVLDPVANEVALADGDYTAYVTSSSSMGKSVSQRVRSWSVSKLVAADGKVMATVKCNTQSAFSRMRIGNKSYKATFVDGVPQFEVPMAINATTTFTVDVNDIGDSIAYRITVTVPLNPANANDVATAKKKAQSAQKKAASAYVASDAALVTTAAKNLQIVTSKGNVYAIELEVASNALDDAIASAKPIQPASGSKQSASSKPGSKSSASSVGSKSSAASGGSSGSGGAAGSSASAATAQSSGSSPTAVVTGGSRSQVVPTVAGRTSSQRSVTSGSSSASSKSSSKSSASASSSSASEASAQSKSGDSASSEQPATGGDADDVSVSGVALAGSSDRAGDFPWHIVGAGFVTALLLAGMCTRTLLFIRAKDVA